MEDTNKFIQLYNSLVPSINLTLEHIGNSVNFLDLQIFKGYRFSQTSILDVKTYQKPLNLYLYIPFYSNHPEENFKSFVTGELKRYVITNGREKDFLQMQKVFYKRILKRRYLPSVLLKWFDMVTYDMRQSLIFKENPPVRVNVDQSIQETRGDTIGNNLLTGEEIMKSFPSTEDRPSRRMKDMEEDKELLVYKTKYDRKFKNIGIKKVINKEMKNTLARTNDEFVKAVLNKVEPMTCFMRSRNLSDILTRSNVEVYTKAVHDHKKGL